MSKCDLTKSHIDYKSVNVRGRSSNVAGLRIKATQKSAINFSDINDQNKIDVRISPIQSLMLYDIRYGIRNKVAIVVDCIVIGSFAGLAYCIISALFRKGPVLGPFPEVSSVCSLVLILISLGYSVQDTKSRLDRLAKSRFEGTCSSTTLEEGSDK